MTVWQNCNPQWELEETVFAVVQTTKRAEGSVTAVCRDPCLDNHLAIFSTKCSAFLSFCVCLTCRLTLLLLRRSSGDLDLRRLSSGIATRYPLYWSSCSPLPLGLLTSCNNVCTYPFDDLRHSLESRKNGNAGRPSCVSRLRSVYVQGSETS